LVNKRPGFGHSLLPFLTEKDDPNLHWGFLSDKSFSWGLPGFELPFDANWPVDIFATEAGREIYGDIYGEDDFIGTFAGGATFTGGASTITGRIRWFGHVRYSSIVEDGTSTDVGINGGTIRGKYLGNHAMGEWKIGTPENFAGLGLSLGVGVGNVSLESWYGVSKGNTIWEGTSTGLSYGLLPEPLSGSVFSTRTRLLFPKKGEPYGKYYNGDPRTRFKE